MSTQSNNETHTSLPISLFKVAVLGTGLYGRALADRIRSSGIDLVVGSRSPSPENGILSHSQAVVNADIVILAVPPSAYSNVVEAISQHLSKQTIVVDIANRPLSKKFKNDTNSTVDHLRKLLPLHKHLAKAFNTISAYNIAPNSCVKSVPMVQYACDTQMAQQKLTTLIRSLRMIPVYFGGLNTAIDLERSAHRKFPLWRIPIGVSAIVWLWWILYSTLTMYVIKGKGGHPCEEWETFPIYMFMASTGETAMTLFAVTFLAGPIAILLQLIRNSTSKPFGIFLGSWLGMRKELGVLGFVFSVAHVLAGAVANREITGGSKGQLYAVFGIMSFMMYAILAVSSNKSVANEMSWAEFQIIFSYLGVGGLVFGVLHQGFWGAQFLKQLPNSRTWTAGGVLMPRYWLGIILPILAILLRLITWSPWVLLRVRKMRGDDKLVVL